MQADEIALGVETGGHLALRDRPVEVMRLVFLAAPDQLDRDAREFLGNGRGLTRVVLCATTPAEAAAQIDAVDVAFADRQAGHFRQRRKRGLDALRRHPGFRLVGRVKYRAVHRFHAGMGEERRAVDRFDFLRRRLDGLVRIAILAVAIGRGRRQAFLEMFGDRGVRDFGVVALVPDDRQRVERRLGVPPGVGDHRDRRVADLHDLLEARTVGDLRLIVAHQLAAEHRRILDGDVQHAGQLDVDRINLAAVELVGGIEPLHRLAGDLPVPRIFELDALRVGLRQLGRGGGDLAVAGRAVGGGMGDHAVRDREFADRHLPFVSRRLQQHHAGGRAAAADVVLRGADAAAAAGRHVAPGALAGEVASGRDGFDRHLLPVAFEFLGDELRKAGDRALAHLRARDADDAGIVRLDGDPDVDLGRRCALRGRRLRTERHVESERQPAACGCGADDEMAA